MSSLALYRRYRPETFAEVIGQEHVTTPLQQALRNNRVNHAYLFSGPRGCGKTTSARILARCLNCEQGPTPTPCGECRSCLDLARNGPGSIDVIEIDAASHGGVDDARELREKAFFGPAASRYKIYIIDEAHMVTSAGFNALLKVVEEPPEHLKFIFATTEPEKVIGTIRSRTHHYPFRLVPPGTLRDYLREVCEREAIAVDGAVLPLVVRAGAGSVRDSMSVMDQLLAGADEGGVTYEMATSLLGYTDGALLDDVVEAFAAGDGAAAFGVVDRVIEGGHDPRRFVADLLERLRDLLILAAVPDAAEKGLIDVPADVLERMRAQAGRLGPAELSRAADLVNAGLTEMRGATSPRLQLELICARVLLPAAYGGEQALLSRIDRLERGAAFAGGGAAFGGGGAGTSAAPPVAAGPGPVAAAPASAPVPSANAPSAAPPPANAPAAPAVASPAASGPGAPAPEAPAAPAPAPAPSAPAPGGAAPGGGARPGAWPTGSGPAGGGPQAGGGPAGGARPGAWPTGSGAAGGEPARQAPPPPAQGQPPAAPPSAAAPAAASSAPPAPTGGSDRDAARVRQLWPEILEAVKGKRRFSWILLSQNAQVAGFDGGVLRLGFATAGARDSFVNSGSEDVLRQALGEAMGVQWRIEAVVDPGGSGQGGGPGGPGPGGGPPGGFGGARPGGRPAGQAPPQAPAVPRPAAAPQAPGPSADPSPASPAPSGPPAGSGRAAAAARAAGAGPTAPAPAAAPVSADDDVPAEDDPDLEDTALAGYELIVRELGATVIEEFHHE
ncbi:DNA polymerase III subunit gamma and tau [Streptomyces hoynatensis]|uniref:DNA polymerase III subunit gamma/tau n=1 Tax=Streptomyces hoynatensis TaxID=1141874 RepID=A0A3A9Z4Z1_9ACTN|nr:DNA polymerase III subunit gamma and tau [Streptomyces hoynatensis]RKN43099.1 DNA polymerase III subunit gamma and tau [Streptomyces hoynatensis]